MAGQHEHDEHGETRKQRVNRELMELLNELRIGLPGVQFLFAFLLVLPFQRGASQATPFQHGVYFVTLMAAVLASILLIGPAAQHRVLFRQHDKEALLHRSSRSAYAGLMVLAVAISSAVLLVVDFFIGRWQAWTSTVVVTGLLVFWWTVVPLWHRGHNEQEQLHG